jgi:hypothetical protein
VKFFPNIDHHLLRSQFHRLIRDSAILQIIDTVIQSGSTVVSNPLEPTWYPGDDLFSVLRPKGIPIGNLTSQFFANVFLDPVDHAMKETVRIPGYIRYADDILFFGDSKEQLWEACGKLKGILCGLRLSLHQDKTFVGQSDQGVRFLGCRVFPHQRRLAQTSLNRMQKRIRRWRQQAKERKVDFPEIRSSLQSWDSYARFCNSKMIRRRINKSLRLRFGKS